MNKQTNTQEGTYPDIFVVRKEYSPQTAMLFMIEKFKESRDKGGSAAAVLMDISKAFDTINHKLLIAKFHAY